MLIDYITAAILRSGKENPWMVEVMDSFFLILEDHSVIYQTAKALLLAKVIITSIRVKRMARLRVTVFVTATIKHFPIILFFL
jgi:hypothetical protein